MNAPSGNGKAALRSAALVGRDAIPLETRISASLAIADAVLPLIPETAEIVGGYLPIRSEVDPRPLMALLRDRRLRLAVPAIPEAHRLEFRELVPGAPLEPQGLGTVAPGASAPVLLPEILLVPLAAFDRSCHRLGYGRGFYDRAIAALTLERPGLIAIGLAFAAQEIAAVPAGPFDVPLDAVVTEREAIRPRR